MIKSLVKLANHLDNKGLTKEADYLDNIIKEAASGENVFRYDTPEGMSAQRAQRRRENPNITDEYITDLSSLDANPDDSYGNMAEQIDETFGTKHPERFQPKNRLDVADSNILGELWSADPKDFPETFLFFKQIKSKLDRFLEENELPAYSLTRPVTLDKASSEFSWNLQDVIQGVAFSGDITLRITGKAIYNKKRKFEVFTSFISDELLESHPKLESLMQNFSTSSFIFTDDLEKALNFIKEQLNHFKDFLV